METLGLNLYEDLSYSKKLTSEQTIKLFEAMANGNESARDELILSNIKLVKYIVIKKFFAVDYDKEELFDIGIEGLIKAVDSFDVKKGFKFSVFAWQCITNEILMFLRKLKRSAPEVSINTVVVRDKDDIEKTLEDTIKDPSDMVGNYEIKEEHQIIRDALNYLDPRSKKIIKLYFGIDCEPHTAVQIAKMLGMTRSNVSKITRQALNEIGQIFVTNSGVASIDDSNYVLNDEMANDERSIYEIFNNHSKETIDKALKLLTENERQIISLKYGEDLTIPFQSQLNSIQTLYFYNHLVKRIQEILRRIQFCQRRKRINQKGQLRTIYELIEGCSKEEINHAISLLTSEEKEILTLRFGENLDVPFKSMLAEDKKKLLFKLLRKIKKISKDSHKAIFDYFEEYTKEQIMAAISKLSQGGIEILKLKYGEDLSSPNYSELSFEQNNSFYYYLKKIKKILKNPSYVPGQVKKSNTIYDYFSDYSQEQVNAMLSQLSESEMAIVNLRFGENLSVPHKSKLNSSQRSYFYHILKNKMISILENLVNSSEEQANVESEEVIDSYYLNPEQELNSNRQTILLTPFELLIASLKYGCINSKEFTTEEIADFLGLQEEDINNIARKYLHLCQQILNREGYLEPLTSKEELIVSLKLGFINGKIFSTEDISRFLGMGEEEIIETIRRTLQLSKQYFDKFISEIPDNGDQSRILKPIQ